jgi:hypothetical protein
MSITRRSRADDQAAKLLARDEARRIAVNIAKLPDFAKPLSDPLAPFASCASRQPGGRGSGDIVALGIAAECLPQ